MAGGVLNDVMAVGVGTASGALSAVFGVGGSMLTTPAVRLIGASAAAAVATPLVAVIPSSIMGTIRYSRQGLVEWSLVGIIAPFGALSAIGGAAMAYHVPGGGKLLMLVTAAMMAATGLAMLRRLSREHAARAPVYAVIDFAVDDDPEFELSHTHKFVATTTDKRSDAVRSAGRFVRRSVEESLDDTTQRERAFLIALVVGTVSGLLGLGCGFLLVPAFVTFFGLSFRRAIASSIVCVGAFALPALAAHASAGTVDWRLGIMMAIGVLPGSYFASRFVVRAKEHHLQIAFGIFVTNLAIVFALAELYASRG
jgi:hypothetical protein